MVSTIQTPNPEYKNPIIVKFVPSNVAPMFINRKDILVFWMEEVDINGTPHIQVTFAHKVQFKAFLATAGA